ncbi:hypothetical protein BH10PSE2_BH10PSE2_03220 [soil metagenome]
MVIRERGPVIAACPVVQAIGGHQGLVIEDPVVGSDSLSFQRTHAMIRSFAAASAVLALLVAAPAFAADDTITLTFDTGAQTGNVMVALFGSEDAYAGHGAPVAQTMVNVAAGQHVATFTVPAGDYAMKAFHDVDGDGKMGTNPFGMPTEPYAFSNNAHGNMGPATWTQAHFTVAGPTAQTIEIR